MRSPFLLEKIYFRMYNRYGRMGMNIVYALIHLLTLVGMCTSIVWLAFHAKRKKIKHSFMLCQTLIMIWAASKILDMLAVNESELYMCYLFGNLGVCFIGAAWVSFCSLYFSKDKKTPVKVLYAISALNYLAVASNPLHGLYYNELSIHKIDHGILFYENVVFTYMCIAVGIAKVYKKSLEEKIRFKRQATLIAVSVLIPLVLNVFYITGNLSGRFDPTPFGFAMTSILILLAVYKYDFLDVNYVTFPKIFTNVPGGIVVVDRFDEITYINETARELLGKYQNIKDVYVLAGEETAKKNHELPAETEVTVNDRRLNIKCYTHYDNNAVMATAFIITDISRYYELIEKTRKLNAANEEIAVEKERNRIAQEVHDTAGHTLTMISSAAKILKIKYPGLPDEVNEYIEKISSESTAGITALRMAVNNMKRYSYTGITESISELADSVKQIECTVCFQGEETEKYLFSAAAIYTSCREAITNSLRYSGADRIDIIVKFLEKSLEVYVFDNGCGCSEILEGNGLTGTVKRIEEIGGEVGFMSSEGNGFTTAIKIPLGEKI